MAASPESNRRVAPMNADEVRAQAETVIQAYPHNQAFSAASVLQDHPEFNQFATIVVDLAYEEFCRQVERGESIDPKVFAEGFPAVSDQLYRQLLFHLALAEDDADRLTTQTDWPNLPSQYLHFDLLQLMGEGGASKVYLAADRNMDMRARVVKVSRTSHREVKSLAKLSHPSIVDALYCESDIVGGFEILCLPLQGRWTLQHVIHLLKQHHDSIRTAADLWKVLAQTDDTPEWARNGAGYQCHKRDSRSLPELIMEWAQQIISGLVHAHTRGFLHCDIKPSNILVGWSGCAILLDFDAALPLSGVNPSCGGTLAYMAPEQLRLLSPESLLAGSRLDVTTDLYSWAVTFYELLSLELPFGADPTPGSLKQAIQAQLIARTRPPIDWRVCRQKGPRELVLALQECLRESTTTRPVSAEAVKQQLQRFDRPLKKALRTVTKHPIKAAVIAAGALLVGVFLNSLFWGSPEQATEAGFRALAANQLSSAYQCFSQALARQPKLGQARVGLVKTLLCQSQYDEALCQLDDLPETDWSQRCRAYAFLASGREFSTAVALLRKQIDSGKATPADYNNAAFGLRVSGELADMRQADSWLETAIDADPSFMNAWANRLVVEQRLSAQTGVTRDELVYRATKYGANSVAVQSELAMIWAVRGRTADRKGDQAAAEDAERRARAALEAGGRLGMTEMRLRNVEVMWSRLAKPIAEIRSRSHRVVSEYQILVNPALDD